MLIQEVRNNFSQVYPGYISSKGKFYRELSESIRGYVDLSSHRGWAINPKIGIEVKGLPVVKQEKPLITSADPDNWQGIVFDVIDYFPMEDWLFYLGRAGGRSQKFTEEKNNLPQWFAEVAKFAETIFAHGASKEALVEFLYERKLYKEYKRFGFWNYRQQPYILAFPLQDIGRDEEARAVFQEITDRQAEATS